MFVFVVRTSRFLTCREQGRFRPAFFLAFSLLPTDMAPGATFGQIEHFWSILVKSINFGQIGQFWSDFTNQKKFFVRLGPVGFSGPFTHRIIEGRRPPLPLRIIRRRPPSP